MNDGTKKLIAWIVLIVIITGIFLGFYFGFKNSPLGKAFGGLFGTLSGVTSAFDKMVQGCNKNGWANPKQCPLGIALIVVASLFVASSVYKFVRWGRANTGGAEGSAKELVERYATISEKSVTEIVDGITEKLSNEKLEEIIKTFDAQEAEIKIQSATIKELKSQITELQTSQGASDQNIEETNVMAETALNTAIEESIEMSDMSQEDASDIANDTQAEDLFPTVETAL